MGRKEQIWPELSSGYSTWNLFLAQKVHRYTTSSSPHSSIWSIQKTNGHRLSPTPDGPPLPGLEIYSKLLPPINRSKGLRAKMDTPPEKKRGTPPGTSGITETILSMALMDLKTSNPRPYQCKGHLPLYNRNIMTYHYIPFPVQNKLKHSNFSTSTTTTVLAGCYLQLPIVK